MWTAPPLASLIRRGLEGYCVTIWGVNSLDFPNLLGLLTLTLLNCFAVRETFILFVTSSWVQDKELVIECDSKNVVSRVNKPSSTPWNLRNLTNHIEKLKLKVKQRTIMHILREANQTLDSLAKEGVSCSEDLVVYNDSYANPAVV
ncbi:hypothetical protein PTKIN_Ptkin14bG0184200 [Pterospermum kingtungense]